MSSPAEELAKLQLEGQKKKTLGSGESKPAATMATVAPVLFTGMKSGKFKLLGFKSLEDVFVSLVDRNLLDDVHTAHEIPINLPGSSFDPTKLSQYIADDLLSIKDNKLFDVLSFIALIKDIQNGDAAASDFDFFNVQFENERIQDTYITNMRCLAFSYLMVMTRGYLPRKTGAGCDNKLPKLLVDNIDMQGGTTEKDFANMLSGADLNKIKVNWMVKLSPSMFPDPIKNRVMKGTAGSRALKIINQAYLMNNDSSRISQSDKIMFLTLATIAQESNCYLNLHPMIQHVQSKIEQFYKSCIALSFIYVGENNVNLLIHEMHKIQSFKNDQVLSQMSFVNNSISIGGSIFKHSFEGKDPEVVKSLFGTPLV
jgi:hypothetical protein